jgi:hypothetical protein
MPFGGLDWTIKNLIFCTFFSFVDMTIQYYFTLLIGEKCSAGSVEAKG